MTTQKRLEALEARRAADDTRPYQCYADFESYQRALAAGKVTARRIYIGVCPDDWSDDDGDKTTVASA